MKNKLLEYINKNKEVTIAAIWRDIEEFRGEFNWDSGPNTIIWTGCSAEGIDGLIELLRQEEVFIKEVPFFWYILEGRMLDYPIANNRNYRSSKPHWLPISLISKDECVRQGRMKLDQKLKKLTGFKTK